MGAEHAVLLGLTMGEVLRRSLFAVLPASSTGSGEERVIRRIQYAPPLKNTALKNMSLKISTQKELGLI